jgi:hypothetical protein
MRCGTLVGLLLALAPLWDVAVASAAVWCHKVRAGETLHAVARRHGTTPKRLVKLNALRRQGLVRAGALLELPALTALRQGQLDLASAPLLATPGNLSFENRQADRQDLSRMRDVGMVRRFVRRGLLLRIPLETRTFWVSRIDPRLRVARPWTKRFIEQLAAGFHGLFGRRLKITSLTRTAGSQLRLRLVNGNAAPAHGAIRSSHLTGASVDISTRPLEGPEVDWLRVVLWRLRAHRVLNAIEEIRQPHFHVMVFRAYLRYARALPSPLLIGGC